LTGEHSFTYNLDMNKLESRIKEITSFYHKKGRMPSFSEIGKITGLRSKNAVFKLVNKLQELKVLTRDYHGRLIPLSIASPVRVLGTVDAGFPSPAEEELMDTISLDKFLIQSPGSTFMLKITGDSMLDAGILPGDMVIVDRSQTPKNGDIVIAEVDGEWTMKYLKRQDNSVLLIPANPKYKPIKPKREFRIGGVVTAVIRKYR